MADAPLIVMRAFIIIPPEIEISKQEEKDGGKGRKGKGLRCAQALNSTHTHTHTHTNTHAYMRAYTYTVCVDDLNDLLSRMATLLPVNERIIEIKEIAGELMCTALSYHWFYYRVSSLSVSPF